MFNVKFPLFLAFTLPTLSVAQETHTHSADGFHTGPPPAGLYSDPEGSRFFELLRSASQISQVPFSFTDTVELSSEIATGYLTEVIPGPSFSRKRRQEGQPVQTILLKIQSSSVLKGDPQGTYLVQYVAPPSMISELSSELYSREILFLLVPASTFFDPVEVEVSLTEEVEAELLGGTPVYDLTSRAALFALSSAGELTSPLGPVKEFDDLYADIGNLHEIAARSTEILSQSSQ